MCLKNVIVITEELQHNILVVDIDMKKEKQSGSLTVENKMLLN